MPEKWTGDLLGIMHTAGITRTELAHELGVGKAYVSMVLNGQRTPAAMRSRMEKAVEAIIQRKEA